MNPSPSYNSLPSPPRSSVRFLSDTLPLNHVSRRRLTIARPLPPWSASALLRAVTRFLGRGVRNASPEAWMH